MTKERILSIVANSVLAVVVALTGWVVNRVVEMERRISIIESSRFRVADGLELWREIGQVREAIAMLPKEVPPKWFIEQFNSMRTSINEVRIQVEKTNREVSELKGRING